MRVALVHSFYSRAQPSGENDVVAAQAAALASAGHEVVIVSRETDDLQMSRDYSLRAAVRVATGRGSNPSAELSEWRPDIVHVHNLFPNFGTRWLEAWPGAVVQTLHNFRTICAAGTLFRDGHDCIECPTAGSGAAIRHACYRNSSAATAPLAWATRRAGSHAPQLTRPNRVIALSQRAAHTFEQLAGPAMSDRVVVVPNFASPEPPRGTANVRDAWLYVGRLSPEKGVLKLIENWDDTVPLDVLGSGPAETACQSAAVGKNIRLLGRVSRATVSQHLTMARGLALPSLWREGLPTVYLEALAAGVPALAVRGNSASDDIAESGAGYVIDSLEELHMGIERIMTQSDIMRDAARQRHASHYTPAAWLAAVESVYERALLTANGRP